MHRPEVVPDQRERRPLWQPVSERIDRGAEPLLLELDVRGIRLGIDRVRHPRQPSGRQHAADAVSSELSSLGQELRPIVAVLAQPVEEEGAGARLLVAGPGDASDLLDDADPRVAASVEVLGSVSEPDKAALLRSVDAYVAPHLGGESFGIVLVEAMAAGAPVVASDLAAFSAVLDGGRTGVLFETGSEGALARAVVDLLADPGRRVDLAAVGRGRARVFDWSVVAERVMAVYETVIEGADSEPEEPTPLGLWGRLVRGVPGGGVA